jgi:hypothetical protein
MSIAAPAAAIYFYNAWVTLFIRQNVNLTSFLHLPEKVSEVVPRRSVATTAGRRRLNSNAQGPIFKYQHAFGG